MRDPGELGDELDAPKGRETAGGSRLRDEHEEDPRDRIISLLATAVQRHGLYPSSNALCVEAVSDCHAAICALPTQSIELGVTPSAVLLDEREVATTPLVSDLAERMFRADMEAVFLQSDLSLHELAQFCGLIASWDRVKEKDSTIEDALIDMGVMNAHVRLVERARVLRAEVLGSERLRALAGEQRGRKAVAGSGSTTLQRGWVRIDTDCELDCLNLIDLAWLTEDPLQLACLLEEASEGEVEPGDVDRLLVERVGDMILLFDRLGADTSAARFGALAEALLGLPEGVLPELLREKLLPELLDTGLSASLLRCFPDEDLMAALEQLAELDVGAERAVRLALARLDLPEPRHQAISERLEPALARAEPDPLASSERAESRIGLGRSGPQGQSLSEYRTLDLAVDDDAKAEMIRISAMDMGEDPGVRLGCITNLLFLGRNPHRIQQLMEVAEPLLEAMRPSDASAAARWVSEWVQVADSVREARPDVAGAMEGLMSRLCSADFLRASAPDLGNEPGLADLVAAFGPAAAPSFVEALEEESNRHVRRLLLDFMCDKADRFSEGLAPFLHDERWTVQRNVALVLGFGGPGREDQLRPLTRHPDLRIARQAIMSLARMGSTEAAEAVVEALHAKDLEVAAFAEEAIRRFPREESQRCAREVLADHVFCVHRPALARSLVVQVVSRDPQGSAVLPAIAKLRFHFWRPAVMSLGWAAHRVTRERR